MIDITSDGQIIALVSFALSFMSLMVRRVVLDQEKLKESKEAMKTLQAKIKEATKEGDTKKATKLNEEFMKASMAQMKDSFKPMVFTIVPFIIVFGWLRDNYGEVGSVASLFGYDLGWFGWYFISAMVASMILNKVLGQ